MCSEPDWKPHFSGELSPESESAAYEATLDRNNVCKHQKRENEEYTKTLQNTMRGELFFLFFVMMRSTYSRFVLNVFFVCVLRGFFFSFCAPDVDETPVLHSPLHLTELPFPFHSPLTITLASARLSFSPFCLKKNVRNVTRDFSCDGKSQAGQY